MPGQFPLRSGAAGEAVRDLQRRLATAGYAPVGPVSGEFCTATSAAVRSFQEHRGLIVSGECDEETWRAVVEATWKLGDRLLVLTAPNLRGDDVAELQAQLGRLGFDAGRVDGIFGPSTAHALADFQRNCGLNSDAVCGPDTVSALAVLARQSGSGPGVSTVRERDQLTAVTRSLSELRIIVGQFGGLSSLSRRLVQGLRQRGALVVTSDEPDASSQARSANRFAATVYVGLESRPAEHSVVHFYQVPEFESAGGRALAERIAAEYGRYPTLPPLLVKGMRLPVLRETRMPAVLFAIGPVQSTLDHAAALVDSIVDALESWADCPIDSSTDDTSSTDSTSS
ncbi:MAG: peptidoglycan-binding protein [Ilumatobacteraceae bacterium]